MFPFSLDLQQTRSLLFLGAHCDDIEIGCGGSILRLLAEAPDAHVTWVVFSSNPVRAQEAKISAAAFLRQAGSSDVKIETFRNGYFPYEGAAIKDFFEGLKGTEPDIIFTHHGADKHQDHRLLSELTWNTFRDHLILEYEIPKYDADLGSPNFLIPLEQSLCQEKVDNICNSFASQMKRQWFTPETFWAMLRLRGVEANAKSGYAEGFYVRKAVL
jgi:LmbE family N-acetylglucosaminyl deacetylase